MKHFVNVFVLFFGFGIFSSGVGRAESHANSGSPVVVSVPSQEMDRNEAEDLRRRREKERETFTQNENNRLENPFGIYVGLLDLPTLYSLNLAYNALAFLRLNLGFGYLSIPESDLGLRRISGVVSFFLPEANFSPVVGFGMVRWGFTGIKNSSGLKQANISADVEAILQGKQMTPYLILGFDWQASSGFNVGFGINRFLGVDSIPIWPYISLGYFF